MSIHLVLYSKPGCHLCEGLQAKLAQVQSLDLTLEVRDITARDDWFQAYEYEIPVLVLVRGGAEGVEEDAAIGSLIPLPRLSPRATVRQLEQMLEKYVSGVGSRELGAQDS